MLLDMGPLVWIPSCRLRQGQASRIACKLERCKTIGKTKKTKKTKDSTQIQMLEGGPWWIWLKSLVFLIFLVFPMVLQGCSLDHHLFGLPACFLVFPVVLHGCRLLQGLASRHESKVCHEGYHHNLHIGEEVTETLWVVSNWSQ